MPTSQSKITGYTRRLYDAAETGLQSDGADSGLSQADRGTSPSLLAADHFLDAPPSAHGSPDTSFVRAEALRRSHLALRCARSHDPGQPRRGETVAAIVRHDGSKSIRAHYVITDFHTLSGLNRE